MPAATALIHLRNNYPPTYQEFLHYFKIPPALQKYHYYQSKSKSRIITVTNYEILILNLHIRIKKRGQQQLGFLTVRPPWLLSCWIQLYLLTFYIPTKHVLGRDCAFEIHLGSQGALPSLNLVRVLLIDYTKPSYFSCYTTPQSSAWLKILRNSLFIQIYPRG